MSTDPRIAGATIAEEDLPARFRDPAVIPRNIEAGQHSLHRVPNRYRDAVADVPEVTAWVRTLVRGAAEHSQYVPRIALGPSLLLVGATGCGKSYQAWGAVRALALSGAECPWQYTTAADLYAKLRPRHRVDSEEEFETYARAGVLVLDDIGAAKASEWTEEVNYRLINHRYEAERPTLITTNVKPAALPHELGERVFSRLVEMARRVVVTGADRRLGKGGTS